MHHPIKELKSDHIERMHKWRENHGRTLLFYAHMHESAVEGNDICLQALDPDKAIGESPCLTYFDTETKELRKACYFCPVPRDFHGHFGISCYRPEEDIVFAIENRLKNLELRPDVANCDPENIKVLIGRWRACGGENLCIHLPDIAYAEGKVCPDQNLERLIDLAVVLKAERFTQHVPLVTVKTMKAEPDVLQKIAIFLAEKCNTLKNPVTIGIENIHMTAPDQEGDERRFGYLPEDCLAFMHILRKYCQHKVGINFDIGHARNNAPYSQKYQISTWFAMVGQDIVGYHLHQVTLEDGVYSNHMPITDVYGKLISYASFFKYWTTGEINKAPVIFEMRPENAYQTTLDTFRPHAKF